MTKTSRPLGTRRPRNTFLYLAGLAFACVAATAFHATPARAASPALQVNPLEYQSTITGSDIRTGFVDVANPGDTTINVTASVQGFRQADLAGDLAFFASAQLNQAIVVALPNFSLGPRQAVRVAFSVDPTKLPKGGVYAVIFFRTVPPPQSSATSFIAESANVGTLLLLQNGPAQDVGRIKRLNLGFLQFGAGITGAGLYQNTNATAAPVAFKPHLISRIWPWGRATTLTAPLVLPGATRAFAFNRPGSYFGLLPVTLTDPTTGRVTIAWVFALTGAYALGLLVLVACAGLLLFYRLFRPSQTFWPPSWRRRVRKVGFWIVVNIIMPLNVRRHRHNPPPESQSHLDPTAKS